MFNVLGSLSSVRLACIYLLIYLRLVFLFFLLSVHSFSVFVCFTFTATTSTTTTTNTGCRCLAPFFQPLLSTVVVEKLQLSFIVQPISRQMNRPRAGSAGDQPASNTHCYTEFCPVSAVLEHERTTFSKRKRERELASQAKSAQLWVPSLSPFFSQAPVCHWGGHIIINGEADSDTTTTTAAAAAVSAR